MNILVGLAGSALLIVAPLLVFTGVITTKDDGPALAIAITLVYLACRFMMSFFRTLADEANGSRLSHPIPQGLREVSEEPSKPSALDDPDWKLRGRGGLFD